MLIWQDNAYKGRTFPNIAGKPKESGIHDLASANAFSIFTTAPIRYPK